MSNSQVKKDILYIVSSIEDSLEDIENIVEDVEDLELYEITREWVDKSFSIIETGSHKTIQHLNKIL